MCDESDSVDRGQLLMNDAGEVPLLLVWRETHSVSDLSGPRVLCFDRMNAPAAGGDIKLVAQSWSGMAQGTVSSYN
jgi:hypothetical protein